MSISNELNPAASVTRGIVLHAENDPVHRRLVRDVLSEAGYRVESVDDGRKCLDKLDAIRPDVILMDIGLPAGDGIMVCRQIKASDARRDIPVIFITAATDDGTLTTAFEAGGADYVRRPVSRCELVSRVNAALDQRKLIERRSEHEKLKGALETAGMVCHELNQPLQFALGSLQLLMLDVARDDPKWQQLQTIIFRIEQMGEITRKLADVTRCRTRQNINGRDLIDLEQAISSGYGKH